MINGTSGDDILFPEPGSDAVTINGNNGNDTITGTEFADTLNGNAGTDTIFGLDGADKINGGADADFLYGGDGDDDITFDAADIASGEVDAGTGFDTGRAANAVTGLDLAAISIERFFGSTGDDVVTAALSSDGVTVSGNNGNDTITGSAFDDRLNGNAGNDTIFGGDGNDIISGGADIDVLDGGAGDRDILFSNGTTGVFVNLQVNSASGGDLTGDTFKNFEGVIGTNHNDNLVGNTGANILIGGFGADRLNGSGGADSLFGNDGDDDITFDQADLDGGVVDAGNGIDTVRASGAVGDDENFVDMAALNAERFFGSSQDDFVFSSGSATVTLNGNNGDDYIGGGSGDDRLNGNAGEDILVGGAGNDKMNGGSGGDSFQFLSFGDFGNDDINGFEGGGVDSLFFDEALGLELGDFTFSQTGNGALISVDDGLGTTGSILLRGVNQVDLQFFDITGVGITIFEA